LLQGYETLVKAPKGLGTWLKHQTHEFILFQVSFLIFEGKSIAFENIITMGNFVNITSIEDDFKKLCKEKLTIMCCHFRGISFQMWFQFFQFEIIVIIRLSFINVQIYTIKIEQAVG
jgi:hypothetical protein